MTVMALPAAQEVWASPAKSVVLPAVVKSHLNEMTQKLVAFAVSMTSAGVAIGGSYVIAAQPSTDNVVVIRDAVEAPTPDTTRQIPKTPRLILEDLKSTSGLTWDQVARLLGVSRRAIHNWASGGALTAANDESLRRIAQTVLGIPGNSPVEVKAHLLARGANGLTLFQELSTSRRSSIPVINPVPFSATDLLLGDD